MAKAITIKTIAAGKVNLGVHPKAKELSEMGLTILSNKESKDLKEDIAQRGIEFPILLTKDGKQIIDGRNRWMIAHELKLNEVPVEYFDGKDEDILGVIVARNAMRRHLSKDQRDMLVALVKAPPMEKEAAQNKGGRPSSKAGTFNGKPTPEGKSVAKKLAEEMEISQHRAQQLEKVRKAGRKVVRSVVSGKRTLRQGAKDAGTGPSKRRAKQKTLEEKVWTLYRRLLGHKWFTLADQREVKQHLRNFLSGKEPKSTTEPKGNGKTKTKKATRKK